MKTILWSIVNLDIKEIGTHCVHASSATKDVALHHHRWLSLRYNNLSLLYKTERNKLLFKGQAIRKAASGRGLKPRLYQHPGS